MPTTFLRGRNYTGPNAVSMGATAPAGTGTTVVLTTTSNAAAAGTNVWAIAAWIPTGAGETVTFTDNVGGNTWTTDINALDSSNTNAAVSIGRCRVTNAIGIGATITATFSATLRDDRMLCALNEKGLLSDLPPVPDGSSSNSGATSSATPGSVTPTNNPDGGIMAVCNLSVPNRTGTPPAGWAELFDFADGDLLQNSLQVNIMSPFTQSLAALNPTETLSGVPTGNWVAAMVLYKYTRRWGTGMNPAPQGAIQAAVR